jgi:hypothetical protein
MINVHRLQCYTYGAVPCYTPCWFSFVIFLCQFLPFLESLLLTWNPSFCVVRSRPPWSQVAHKLTSPLPIPSPFQFPDPQGFPKSVVRLTKTTSRSRLYIVRNNTQFASYVWLEKRQSFILDLVRHYTAHVGSVRWGNKCLWNCKVLALRALADK